MLDFRKLWNPQEPAIASIKKISNLIDKKLNEGEIIRLGGMTDCFQPIELKERVTYNTIEKLNSKNIGYLIVTKSDIVANDGYINLMRKRPCSYTGNCYMYK